MLCEIFVKQTEAGFVASVFGFPACTAEAASRAEASAQAKAKAQGWTATGEFVEIVGSRGGRMQARESIVPEAEWNEFLAAMKAYRDEIDADPNAF